jgi:cytidylate kinase
LQFNVIAISRTLGAGGEDLGSTLADSLGFRYVDTEILDRAAAVAGLTRGDIERVEARKGLLTRILENLARSGALAGAGEGVPPDLLALPGYEQLIVDVIRETADMQFVVIVAHGASIPLAGRAGLLRIMVTASKETRVKRVAQAQGVPEEQARRTVDDSDKARADYFRRFFNLDHELPTHYDLLVNTDVLNVEQAGAAVLAVAKA